MRATTLPPTLRDPQRAARPAPLPRVIAVANQKGGVGKTTTTVNLGACLAELGFRTLVIDLDPQGNASTGLGIENRGLETSMYHVIMHEVPLEDCIEPSAVQEPLRRSGQPRSGRRRDRARAGVQPGEPAAAGDRRRCSTTTTTCSSTARRRSAC